MSHLMPWQQEQWQALQNMRNDGRLPHALLFAGPRGLGKAQFALEFIYSLFCLTPTADKSACRTCRTCALLAAETQPDFRILQPEETGKTIKIEQVRNHLDWLKQSSQQGNLKILLIQSAERLNMAASNALLKTLEEPGRQTLIILVTHQPNLLAATIYSRCQLVKFTLPPTQIAKAWLEAQLPGKVDDINFLLTLAGGAPLRAYELAETEIEEKYRIWTAGLQKLLSGHISPLSLAKEWQKAESTALLDYLIWVINFYLKGEKPIISLNIKPQKLFELYDKLIRNRELLRTHQGLNDYLLLEDILIDCFCMAKP